MKLKKTVITCGISLIIVLAMLSIIGCQSPASPSSEVGKLQIGGLMSLTGGFSGAHDIPDWNQALIAAEIINENGGVTVNGQKYNIEMVAEDCKSTMDGVTSAANRLVFDKGIKFIIGPCAFFSSAAGPITDPNKVIRSVTYSCNTPGEMDESTPYAFLGSPGAVSNAVACAKYLKQNYPEVKKVAIVTPDDGAASFLIPKVTAILADNGIEVAGEAVVYSNDLNDMSPIAMKINAIEDADATFQANGLDPHVGGIIKVLRELGNKKPYACSTSASLTSIANITGTEACKDVFLTNVIATDPDLPPLLKEICDRTVAEYGDDYPQLTTAASSLYCLTQAIETAQSLDTTVVRDTWQSMDKIETIYGMGQMGGEITYGIKHAVGCPTQIQIIKDGKLASAGWIDIGVIP